MKITRGGGGVFASPVHKACSCVPLSLKWPGRMSAERLLSKALCYEDAEPNNNSKTATTPLSSKMASASNVCAEGQLGVWWRCLVVWCKVQVMRRFLLSYCFPRSFPYRLVSGAKHYPPHLKLLCRCCAVVLSLCCWVIITALGVESALPISPCVCVGCWLSFSFL